MYAERKASDMVICSFMNWYSHVMPLLISHSKWLKSKGSEGKRADLSDADFSNVNLEEANARRLYFDSSYAYEITLSGIIFSKVILKRVNFRGSDLSYAYLDYADLRNANLYRSNLSYADLRNADLRNADLHRSNLSYADLRNTDLRNTNFHRSNLNSTDLNKASLYSDLRNPNLLNTNLRGVCPSDTDLSEIDFGEEWHLFR